MSITTRPGAAADAALLHDLAARTFELACPPGTLRSDIDAFIAANLSRESFGRYLADPDRIILLTAIDDVPVGYSMLIGGPIADPDVAKVMDAAMSVVVSPPVRATAIPATSIPGGAAPGGAAHGAGSTDSIELSKFYLALDRHGSGAAAALMSATLAAAAGTGAAFCWLGVNQQNERAARFYAKHGFEVVGVKRFQVGEVWHDDHIRLRALP
jgi:ribosomal protein S18 acetylase RimI-like enzyme